MTQITQSYINDICYKIVGAAIEVHKEIEPGLLESVYHKCMIEELIQKGLSVRSSVQVPITYKHKSIEGLLIIDLLVNDVVIVELKAVDKMIDLYKAQLLSYLKLSGKPKGLLINFHCENIVKQLVPIVIEEFRILPAA